MNARCVCGTSVDAAFEELFRGSAADFPVMKFSVCRAREEFFSALADVELNRLVGF